jgi:hypothetical protein
LGLLIQGPLGQYFFSSKIWIGAGFFDRWGLVEFQWTPVGPQSKVLIGRDSCSKLARLCRFWLSRRQGVIWDEFERIAPWESHMVLENPVQMEV